MKTEPKRGMKPCILHIINFYSITIVIQTLCDLH